MDTTGLKTSDRVRESNPGPTKRSCCKVRESNPGPTKKIECKARGSNPGPTKKIARAIVHTIANTIAHMIVKINMHTKYVQMHERVPCGTCPLDDGRWPDWPKNGQQTDRLKNDKSFEKICSLHKYLFWGTTSCTNSCTFLQAESACNNTYVEYVPKNVHHAHLHDKCMITVFCHQIISDLATTHPAPQHFSPCHIFCQLLSRIAVGLVFLSSRTYTIFGLGHGEKKL